MKCIISTTRTVKTVDGNKTIKEYYIKSSCFFYGMQIPEFSTDRNEAEVFSTKREAEQTARHIRGNTTIEPLGLYGKKVVITDKESIYHGEWGTVVLDDCGEYHIAIAGGTDSIPVFDRDQFRVKR